MRGAPARHPRLMLALFATLLLASLFLSPLIGSVEIDFEEALRNPFTSDDPDSRILTRIRVPRVLMAALTGAALSVSGVVLQALLRNSLATPYTTGIASGSAFGAVMAIRFGLDIQILGLSPVPLAALVGSLSTAALVYFLARAGKRIPTATLLLAGVTVSFVYGGAILFLHYISDFTQSYQMLRWLMGGLDIVGYGPIRSALPFVTLGMVLVFWISRELNILSLGEEPALARGVSVQRVQKTAFLGASLLAASVVAMVGPIGFVGLVVPHVARLLVGPDHRILLPASILLGASFLIICDTVARLLIAPAEMPVGILTSLVGGPFFIWLLRREHTR